MRRMSFQNQYDSFISATKREKTEVIKYIFILLISLLMGSSPQKKRTYEFYNASDLIRFGYFLKKMIFFNTKFFRMFFDLKFRGIKAWEYGVFFSTKTLNKGIKILDLGTGSSPLPLFLASEGAEVTCLDLPNPLEKNRYTKNKNYSVKYDIGSMTSLPYEDNSFDLVTSISAIEHLDYDYKKKKVFEYDEFTARTKKTLQEMVRVTKKGGVVYITSDLYIPKMQKTDRWPQSVMYPSIGAAYRNIDFFPLFIETLNACGCRVVNKHLYNPEKLFADEKYSTYRGRYFTTFALRAKKNI